MRIRIHSPDSLYVKKNGGSKLTGGRYCKVPVPVEDDVPSCIPPWGGWERWHRAAGYAAPSWDPPGPPSHHRCSPATAAGWPACHRWPPASGRRCSQLPEACCCQHFRCAVQQQLVSERCQHLRYTVSSGWGWHELLEQPHHLSSGQQLMAAVEIAVVLLLCDQQTGRPAEGQLAARQSQRWPNGRKKKI